MITLDNHKVIAILLINGWTYLTPATFSIDNLDLSAPDLEPPEAEDYGFSCVSKDGHPIKGRASALFAVMEAPAA